MGLVLLRCYFKLFFLGLFTTIYQKLDLVATDEQLMFTDEQLMFTIPTKQVARTRVNLGVLENQCLVFMHIH